MRLELTSCFQKVLVVFERVVSLTYFHSRISNLQCGIRYQRHSAAQHLATGKINVLLNGFNFQASSSPYVLCREPMFLTQVTESQNHTMTEVGRYLCGLSSPTPLTKQGHVQQAA